MLLLCCMVLFSRKLSEHLSSCQVLFFFVFVLFCFLFLFFFLFFLAFSLSLSLSVFPCLCSPPPLPSLGDRPGQVGWVCSCSVLFLLLFCPQDHVDAGAACRGACARVLLAWVCMCLCTCLPPCVRVRLRARAPLCIGVGGGFVLGFARVCVLA